MYPTCEDIVSQLTPTQRAQCDNIAFVILRPDALERLFHLGIVAYFREQGLSLVGWKHLNIDDRDIEEVYRYTQHSLLERSMRPLWWLTRRMYAASPAIVTLWSGPIPSGFQSLSQVVEGFKGPSNPALTKPGQLRFIFPAINVVLCTIHSSDTSMDALREAAIFFSMDEMRRAIDLVPEAIQRGTTEVHKQFLQYCALWDRVRPRSEGFFETLVNLKTRIAARLYELSGFPRAELFEIYATMRNLIREELSYQASAERMHVLLEHEAQVLDQFRGTHDHAVITSGSHKELIEILSMLAQHEHFDTIHFDRVRDSLLRQLIPLDAWECIVLESSLIFHGIQLNGYSAK